MLSGRRADEAIPNGGVESVTGREDGLVRADETSKGGNPTCGLQERHPTGSCTEAIEHSSLDLKVGLECAAEARQSGKVRVDELSLIGIRPIPLTCLHDLKIVDASSYVEKLCQEGVVLRTLAWLGVAASTKMVAERVKTGCERRRLASV